MNCRSCGLQNRPYEVACAHCSEDLQDPAKASAKLREWDLLSPALRAEQEKHYADLRARFDEHQIWLRRHRRLHAAAGAFFVGFGMNAALLFQVRWTIPIDLLIGAAAGLWLNRLGGGSFRGFGIFGGAAALCVLAMIPFVHMEEFLKGIWLLSAFGVMFVAGAGYYLGLKLDIDHVEHQLI